MNKLLNTLEKFVAWLFYKDINAEFRASQEIIDVIMSQCIERNKRTIYKPHGIKKI